TCMRVRTVSCRNGPRTPRTTSMAPICAAALTTQSIDLELVDGHPVIYAGAGSHASYFRRGEYQWRFAMSWDPHSSISVRDAVRDLVLAVVTGAYVAFSLLLAAQPSRPSRSSKFNVRAAWSTRRAPGRARFETLVGRAGRTRDC